MELSPKSMEAISQALAKQIKEAYRALSTQFQQQLEQLDSKCEERIKSTAKLKRKGLCEPELSTFKLDYEEALARIKSKSKSVTATVREEEEVSHSLHINHSEYNELYDPEMTTFKFDYTETIASIKPTEELPHEMIEIKEEYKGVGFRVVHEFDEVQEPEMSTFTFEDTFTSVKAKCDISSMQTDFVLNKLTPKEPVHPSSMILVPQALKRKSVEGAAQRGLPLIINLEDKRCKPPDRERNQLPRVSSFIFPKEIPPDEANQRIYDTQVSLSCELAYYWNNFTYARVIKQPVVKVEISSIMDLIFPISTKEDTGSFDVHKGLTRTGTLWSLKVEQRERTKSVLTSVTPSSTPYLCTSMSSENPKHFNQVSDSFSRFVSHELKSRNTSLFYPRIIEKKLGLFVGRLKQNSYLNMLEKELDDKNNYLDVNEIPLFVYRDSMAVIMHLLFAKGVAYVAGVKEEPPDLKVLSITFFARTGIGVDVTKGKTDLRTNLFEEGEDDMSTASQKREVSSEPELEGRIELRRCLKQFLRLLQKVYSSFQVSKSSTLPFWRLYQVMITR